MLTARSTLSVLQDAETGQRGFLLSGNSRYLEPYRRALAAYENDTAALRRLTSDNARQQKRLDSLATLSGMKFAELEKTIELSSRGKLDSAVAIVKTGEGKQSMDAIRMLLAEFESEERGLLTARALDEAAHERVVIQILVVGTLVAAIIAVLLSRVLARSAKIQRRISHELAEQNTQLQEQGLELELQTQQLQDRNEEMEQQAEEMEMQAEELQQERVRTAQALAESESARHRADEANYAKSHFLATMSHELRTPLNAIGGYVELLEMGIHGPVTDGQREALARVDRAQRRLLGLINDVLNFAKLEAGAVDYDVRPHRLADIITGFEMLIEPQLAAKELKYTLHPPADTLEVLADADKLQQVLLNLLSNAIKFTERGGHITLEVTERLVGPGLDGEDGGRPDVVFVRVHDTGRGIPSDKLERVFEPFVQISSPNSSYTRKDQGTGLGLAISRDLALGMGGELRARSVEGEGSVFTLTLRRADRMVAV